MKNILIDEIANYCDREYKLSKNINVYCSNCSHPLSCPGDCEKCFEQIHFRKDTMIYRRKYNCSNLTKHYVCKYAYKYTSELIYGFENFPESIKKQEKLSVLSVGCGPCTDLFAIDFLISKGTYNCKTVIYHGIDLLKEQWEDIHNQIKYLSPSNDINFYYDDALIIMDSLTKLRLKPDIIVFQYFFSDLQKNMAQRDIIDFIDKMAYYINNIDKKISIIFNDINLHCAKDGGRDYFDILLMRLHNCSHKKFHFRNNNKENHFDYGEEYTENGLRITLPNPFEIYHPFNSCSSAQLLIFKE